MTQVYELAKAMLSGMNAGDMGACVYDAAWVARVRDPETNELAFPAVLEWVRGAQHPNGSWGSAIEYYPANILSTLSALVALAEAAPADDKTREQIRKGLDYVQQAWPLVGTVPFTVGFEVLAHAMLKEAARLHLPVEAWLAEAEHMTHGKLSRFPKELIYSPKFTLSFSLEFLGDNLDKECAKALQMADGSIANSVSATAYYVRQTGDERAMTYLRSLVQQRGPDNVPFVYPFELFEKIWVLYNLHLGGMLDERLMPYADRHLDYIASCTNQIQGQTRGMSFTATSHLADLDDTAVGLQLLHLYGRKADLTAMEPYERDNYFVCYPFEASSSPSVNAHVLDTVTSCPYRNREQVIEKLLVYLREHRLEGAAYWYDKWNISPFYVTAHVVIAAAPHDLVMLQETIDWIVSQQREDGSWGYFGTSSAEETAYCMQALIMFRRHGGQVEEAVLHNAAEFLYCHTTLAKEEYPALWIGKDLYRPDNIIRSALLSAVAMYEADFWPDADEFELTTLFTSEQPARSPSGD